MSRKIFTLFAVLALASCLAVAQDQPAQRQPGQSQSAPQAQQTPQPQHPAGQGQSGMSSQQLQSAFQRTFAQYPELSNVNVSVADDKIELSGSVQSQSDKEKLRRTAEANADGRKVVDDKLNVISGGQEKPPTSAQPPMSEKPPASTQPPASGKPPISPR